MKDNKQLLKESGAGLFKTFIVLAAIVIFKLSFFKAAVLIILVSLTIGLFQHYRTGWVVGWYKKLARSVLTTIVVITAIGFIYKGLGGYTILALILVVLLISGLILWSKRKDYLEIVRHSERVLFGETAEEKKARLKK